jgi:hypothetical protein
VTSVTNADLRWKSQSICDARWEAANFNIYKLFLLLLAISRAFSFLFIPQSNCPNLKEKNAHLELHHQISHTNNSQVVEGKQLKHGCRSILCMLSSSSPSLSHLHYLTQHELDRSRLGDNWRMPNGYRQRRGLPAAMHHRRHRVLLRHRHLMPDLWWLWRSYKNHECCLVLLPAVSKAETELLLLQCS